MRVRIAVMPDVYSWRVYVTCDDGNEQIIEWSASLARLLLKQGQQS